MSRYRTVSTWLVAVTTIWIKCVYGQTIEITSAGELQDGFAFYSVSCSAEVPEETDVTIISDGVGGTANFAATGQGTFANTRIFSPITASDSGVYSCTLEVNDVTIDSVMFGILVATGQLFSVSVSQQMLPAEVGRNYTITCDVTFIQSSGNVSFRWLTGPSNEPIDTSDGFRVLGSDDSSTLVFAPARQSQEGRYSCEATVGDITITREAAEVEVNTNNINIIAQASLGAASLLTAAMVLLAVYCLKLCHNRGQDPYSTHPSGIQRTRNKSHA